MSTMTVAIKAGSQRGQSINYTTLQSLTTYLYLPRLIDNQKSMVMRALKQSKSKKYDHELTNGSKTQL